MSTPLHTVDRIHDLARCRADTLRREAMTDFWRGADAVLAQSTDAARRSAQRLAYRLARRAQQRAVSVTTEPLSQPLSKGL